MPGLAGQRPNLALPSRQAPAAARLCSCSTRRGPDVSPPRSASTTLEDWALLGEECGQATLSLAAHPYPRRQFSARLGIAVGESPGSKVTLRLEVLNAGGKVIRKKEVTALYGYGWQPMSIGLAGGASLRLSWLQTDLSQAVVFGMTAS